jgi:hypothetical protein
MISSATGRLSNDRVIRRRRTTSANVAPPDAGEPNADVLSVRPA